MVRRGLRALLMISFFPPPCFCSQPLASLAHSNFPVLRSISYSPVCLGYDDLGLPLTFHKQRATANEMPFKESEPLVHKLDS